MPWLTYQASMSWDPYIIRAHIIWRCRSEKTNPSKAYSKWLPTAQLLYVNYLLTVKWHIYCTTWFKSHCCHRWISRMAWCIFGDWTSATTMTTQTGLCMSVVHQYTFNDIGRLLSASNVWKHHIFHYCNIPDAYDVKLPSWMKVNSMAQVKKP